jgi:undecaprenyl phosphate N,N'-diacetylbacillosamine 1-phosphate transferase
MFLRGRQLSGVQPKNWKKVSFMCVNVWLCIRRPIDFVFTSILLILLGPLMLVTMFLVKRDGGPSLFKQQRVGLNEKIFEIYKFRSMIVGADRYLDEKGMPTCERITPFGKFIRRTSIDELPQLLNIIRGDMSLIGPRPILPPMLPYMTKAECRRFQVLPGITGLAQVKGRNLMPWSQRFRLDVDYAENAEPIVDLKIMLLTLGRVFSASGISMDRNSDVVDDIKTRDLQKVH